MTVEKDPINIDVQPIAESVAVDEEAVLKSVEDTPPADLLKADDPVAIPSDLDFTPDEALNELVSSDILAVIPEQPAEEVKKPSDEPEPNIIETSTESAPVSAPTPAADPAPVPAEIDVPTEKVAEVEAAAVTPAAAATDEMNVETTETGNLEAENAMESAPIKADDEQMDVDESNSVDAMDL